MATLWPTTIIRCLRLEGLLKWPCFHLSKPDILFNLASNAKFSPDAIDAFRSGTSVSRPLRKNRLIHFRHQLTTGQL
jgi:hypothetical protein